MSTNKLKLLIVSRPSLSLPLHDDPFSGPHLLSFLSLPCANVVQDLKAAFKERGSVVFNKRQLSDDFLKWLIECHKKFDKELEFLDKIGVERDEQGNARTRFATIRYGHGEDSVYRKGDKVR